LKICQPTKGFRFSTDAVVLAQFIKNKKYRRAIDIGSGSGVLATYLAKVVRCLHVDAIEMQAELFECLKKTVEINGLNDCVSIYEGDINEFIPNSQYDLIVSNPPYREYGRGRVSKDKVKKSARFSDTLKIEDIFYFSLKYLQNAGHLYLSFDVDLMVDTIVISREYKLELKRMMFLHHKVNSAAKLVFMEFRKNAGKELIVEAPFIQQHSM
jgi:tRNA1Val (adenine37-N6)-methyltransferase